MKPICGAVLKPSTAGNGPSRESAGGTWRPSPRDRSGRGQQQQLRLQQWARDSNCAALVHRLNRVPHASPRTVPGKKLPTAGEVVRNDRRRSDLGGRATAEQARRGQKSARGPGLRAELASQGGQGMPRSDTTKNGDESQLFYPPNPSRNPRSGLRLGLG